MPSLAVEVLALLLYGPAIVLLHELGHATLARTGGYRVTSFGIGLGKPLWSTRLPGGVTLHLDRWLIAGGACTAVPVAAPSARRAWFHAGGLLFQSVLALVLLALPETWLVERVAQFNVLVAATNGIPWRWGASASDGWYLWDLVTGGRRAGEVLPQRAQLERLARREARIDSTFGRAYAELCLTWVDVMADRSDRAERFFAEQAPELTAEPWVDALYHYVHAEWHRMSHRPLAAVRIARDAMAMHTKGLADESMGLLTLAEAQALADLDEPRAAQRVLARLAGVGGLLGRQAATIHLVASLEADADDLEFATWRVVRRVHEVWLDPPATVLALWEASDRLQRHSRVQAARGARDAARTLARRTLDSADREDRAHLMRRLGQAAGLRPSPGRTGEASP